VLAIIFCGDAFFMQGVAMSSPTLPALDPRTRIGHVHLKVADLERALAFYCGVLGFELTQRYGRGAAFVSAGGYHHHLGLNTWESEGGQPPALGTTGLYHVAILYPTRSALAAALRRLQAAAWPLEGAADHGVSEALYLRDPDGNGLELYRDRPEPDWPHDDPPARPRLAPRRSLTSIPPPQPRGTAHAAPARVAQTSSSSTGEKSA
jgi:catechol 2,3-dioxygenase